MARSNQPPDHDDVIESVIAIVPSGRWKRLAIVAGVLSILVIVGFVLVWSAFFIYVPPGKHLVIVA